jgi:hypothetical protein
MIPIGELAPDLQLPGIQGERDARWRVSDSRGRWVVFKGVLARTSPWLSGLEFFAIALGSAGLGYALGVAISALSG